MGLVQREIESAGITTITLSTIPDFTASVSVPRLAGIEYPQGRPIGDVADVEGQLAVLRATLQALTTMEEAGEIVDLPFTWPEPPKKVHTHPKEKPPIASFLAKRPWHLPKFLSRKISDISN